MLLAVDQHGHPVSEYIINLQADGSIPGQIVANQCTRVKGIGIIPVKKIMTGYAFSFLIDGGGVGHHHAAAVPTGLTTGVGGLDKKPTTAAESRRREGQITGLLIKFNHQLIQVGRNGKLQQLRRTLILNMIPHIQLGVGIIDKGNGIRQIYIGWKVDNFYWVFQADVIPGSISQFIGGHGDEITQIIISAFITHRHIHIDIEIFVFGIVCHQETFGGLVNHPAHALRRGEI